jgi:glycine oxidase
LWPQLLEKLPGNVFFQKNGTLVIAHPQDQAELERFSRSVQYKLGSFEWNNFHIQRSAQPMLGYNRMELMTLKARLPAIFTHGIYLPDEGQIDNKQLLDALRAAIDKTNIEWRTETTIKSLADLPAFDFIIDCRGMGAKTDLNQLRGVRGELLMVEAPEVSLGLPIRLMHPRHPIYIVPRPHHRFIIGATSIESEDMRPITVQSVLELLSAACTVHPGFAEAIVLENKVNCRPTLPNNLPGIIFSEPSKSNNIIRVNGLYRHGFLVAPKLAQLVLAFLNNRKVDPRYARIFQPTGMSNEQFIMGEPSLAISH